MNEIVCSGVNLVRVGKKYVFFLPLPADSIWSLHSLLEERVSHSGYAMTRAFDFVTNAEQA